MADQKKFLDYEGVKHLWSKLSMQDYPKNETLMAVIDAIDETKADKDDLIQNCEQLSTEESFKAGMNLLIPDTSKYTYVGNYSNSNDFYVSFSVDEGLLDVPATLSGYSNAVTQWLVNCNSVVKYGNINYKLILPRIIAAHDAIVENGFNINRAFSYFLVDSLKVSKKVTIFFAYVANTKQYRIIRYPLGDTATQHDGELIFDHDANIIKNTMSSYFDPTLSVDHKVASAKAVGDALATKLDYTVAQDLTNEQKEQARANIGCIQSDLNENDETSSAYVKNRTHWEEEPQEVELVPETTIEITGSDFIERAIDITLVEGTAYTVTWNGTKYECTCYNYDEILVIGNSSCWGGSNGNGEPFLISNYDGITAINIYEEGTYTVSITAIISKIHYLDPKYIKDMYHEYMAPNNDVIIPEQTISSDNDYSYVDVGIESFLTDGASYIVNWNGTEYTCIARYDIWGGLYIGNQAIGVEVDDWQFPEAIESNEPFFLYIFEEYDDRGLFVQTAGEYTVSVVGTGEKLVPYKIDVKYMPDEIVETFDVQWSEMENMRNEINNAYNLANTAKTNAATAQSTADNNASKMLTLTEIETAFPNDITYAGYFCVQSAQGKIIAISSKTRATFAISNDGFNWQLSNFGLDDELTFKALTYAKDRFVGIIKEAGAPYKYSQSIYSTDGVTWVLGESITDINFNTNVKMAYGNGVFVCGSRAETATTRLYSLDGISWTSVPVSHNTSNIIYADGKFVALGSSGVGSYSTDGITWTDITLPVSGNINGLAYGNDKFVAYTYKQGGMYSEDGINWTAISHPSSDLVIQDIIYANGKFVMASYGNSKIAYSENGIDWTQPNNPITFSLSWVHHDGNKFIVGSTSSDKYAYSEDGITWFVGYKQVFQNNENVTDTVIDLVVNENTIPQSDWEQTDETAVDYIKNKPDEEDALSIVAELNLVSPVAAEDGSIYTDENGVLYSL